MTGAMLDAIACAVRMVRGAYGWGEALDYARITYGLDEFEAEDLETLARRQYARLEMQTHNRSTK